MGANDPLRRGQFGPLHGWPDLCRRPPNIATYLICLLFEGSTCYLALYKHMTPWGVASLEPRDLISRIYKGDH